MKKALKYHFLRLCYNVHFENYGLFTREEKGEKSYQYHFTPKKVNLAIILLIVSPVILAGVIVYVAISSVLSIPQEIRRLYNPKRWSSYYQVVQKDEKPSKRKAYENF